ncbi:MAG: SpoIIE family protein phosphatase, partial [Deltaproteobacteria bacterium]|nr:SpoIIE family protein phosphatase [Deltaproteobacteria bacterium]
MWIIAAVLYAFVLWIFDVPQPAVYVSFAQCLLTGLITSVTAFFLLRSTLQRRLAPVFFPSGGLFLTPSTLRIRISVRITALVLACNVVPFLILIVLVLATYQADLEASLILDHLRSNIFINSLIFMVAVVLLMMLVSFNLRQPFQNIIRVLQSVRNGDFNHKVRVTSNDEIGYTGDMVNQMTEGLKERDRLRHSLELAKEVQQHFLPRADPQVAGLDIAGQSRFCDRTGGDYYDYIETPKPGAGKIGVVIGDVSGHGIPSALLMASARSSLRQRVSMGGDIGLVIADVNRQIVRDVGDSGRFMTLFYTEIDASQRSVSWVRAGHEPVIFYDPRQDLIEELKGRGMALGVDENWTYTQYHKAGLERGQIIVLATDGIWEAHNAGGEMFGKDDFHKAIRLHADKGA